MTRPHTLTDAGARSAIVAAKRAAGAYPPCTCAYGRCLRLSHRPMPADCGHGGVYAVTPTGLTRCYRADCADRAGIASAIIALTRGARAR